MKQKALYLENFQKFFSFQHLVGFQMQINFVRLMTWTIKLGKTKFVKTHLSPLSGTTFGQKSCEEAKTWDEWDEKKFNISFEVGKDNKHTFIN
jgi:hypothetical protein